MVNLFFRPCSARNNHPSPTTLDIDLESCCNRSSLVRFKTSKFRVATNYLPIIRLIEMNGEVFVSHGPVEVMVTLHGLPP